MDGQERRSREVGGSLFGHHWVAQNQVSEWSVFQLMNIEGEETIYLIQNTGY